MSLEYLNFLDFVISITEIIHSLFFHQQFEESKLGLFFFTTPKCVGFQWDPMEFEIKFPIKNYSRKTHVEILLSRGKINFL
jgi:hypothetical protein